MPAFAIRIGCEQRLAKFHRQSYELVGLPPNVTILGKEPVFAREVIVPKEGFSHSPLLNYWNLVAVRRRVLEQLGPVPRSSSGRKTVLVIVRDASRRGDGAVYHARFLRELGRHLPRHEVRAFRASDAALMACLACQARAFAAADVVVGSHGAGLSLVLFAREGATVLERIVNDGDSGIYAELPFLLGMKYFPMHSEADALAYRDAILFAESIEET